MALQMEDTSLEKDKRAAWVAVRCANSVGQAQLGQLALLSGDTGVPLGKDSCAHLPECAAYDLLSSYVLGQRKKVISAVRLHSFAAN